MEYPTKEADQGEFSVKDFQENYHTGWIKLYRSVRKHWIYENALYFRAWIDILMEVNHEGKKVLIESELIYCDRGESIYSIQTWIKIFGKEWSRQKVRTFFELLEKDGMIVTKGMRKTTKLTVINYNTYQDMLTNRQPTANQQLTNRQPQLKNVKNVRMKEEENTLSDFEKKNPTARVEYSKNFESFWETLPSQMKMGKKAAFKHYKATVKNEKDYADLQSALGRYKTCDRFKRGFIQYGSTWLNNWRDWLNYVEPANNGRHYESKQERLERNAAERMERLKERDKERK